MVTYRKLFQLSKTTKTVKTLFYIKKPKSLFLALLWYSINMVKAAAEFSSLFTSNALAL